MSYRLLVILVLVLQFSVPGPLSAQQPENIRFERFTLRNGLASDWVQSITQDQKGYIWIGTAAGLSHYDGYDFINYRNIPGNPRSLANNRVNVVYVDKSGNIWVGTQNGLSRYNQLNEEFDNFYNIPGDPKSLPGNVVSAIHESVSGQLWIGTDNGLAELDRKTGVFNSQWLSEGGNVSLNGANISSISEDRNGTLWIGTNNKGLITFNISKNIFRFLNEQKNSGVLFPSSNISKVLVASSGEIWIGFLPDLGLVRYNPETNTSISYSHHEQNQPDFWNIVSDIIETSDHTIWVTTYANSGYSGLHMFDGKTGRFSRFTYQPYNSSSLTWPYCETVFEDKDNNLWVGTSRGLNKADLSRWQMGMMNVDPQNPYDFANNFYAIEEVENDVFWFGLDGNGFTEWDRKSNKKKQFPPKDPRSGDGTIYTIRKDYDGMIWFGYKAQGCARYNPKTGQLDKYLHEAGNPGSLIGNFVSDILIDRKNNVWIATSNGLSRFNREQGNFTSWQKGVNANEMSGNSLFSLFQDSRGLIWIGTRDHNLDPNPTFPSGLMKFDPETNHFKSYRYDPNDPGSLSSDAVFCVNEDLSGNIWVGTNNGLNKLDLNEEKFEVFHDADGLPNPNIIGILVDNEGILWLSTLKGISRFNPATKSFRNFTMEDGMQAYRFNDNSRLKTSSGELIFGGVAGANFFDPADVFSEKVIPEVYITRFLIQNVQQRFDKPLNEIEKINLAWNDNSIGFEFVAINFRSSQQTLYEYMLEGFEKEWVRAGTRRYVNYTHLPAGNYLFRVRAMNSDGAYSETDAVITVKITPPFWRTWWAYIIYALVFIGLIFIVDRYQRQRLIRKEREQIRDRELSQAKEIEKAYTELKNTQAQLIQSEKMASLGELTAGIAHEIQNPLNFVNNFAEVSGEMIDEMKEELAEGSRQYAVGSRQLGEEKLKSAVEIADDLKQNLEKINHHGKRADAIVKGMLQHSRSSNGVKEPTDINALADEYLRLAYHGLRAKDSSFNADFKTEFDPDLPNINVIPQDIGRVLLNLINNAFYAVSERQKNLTSLNNGYKPIISISTKNLGNRIEISVNDNGPGIPEEIKNKIFQPFFTTKPTGQGTGLGLSMSYDIITKGHAGEISVASKDGEGTEFTVQLPIS
jgi:signal transduction histidine kinase/ligand-binding sensor domain-containing protein